jgi:hypothetical protein
MNTRIKVNVSKLAPGSCFTDEQVAELSRILSVEIPVVESGTASVELSKEANGLASYDALGAILVPGATVFGTSSVWLVGTTIEMTFEGWNPIIDPTSKYCVPVIYPIYQSSDGGIDVQGDPNGTRQIRPSMEITQITATSIKLKLFNVSRDTTVYIRLLMLPIPPQKA